MHPGGTAVDTKRKFWTVATRDFRNVLGIELMSREEAHRYRDAASLEMWVVVRVHETDAGRTYASPELPDGPLLTPVAGTFRG